MALSIQDGNRSELGVSESGKVDMSSRKTMMSDLESSNKDLGFSDVKTNSKHGTIDLPRATISYKIRFSIRKLDWFDIILDVWY